MGILAPKENSEIPRVILIPKTLPARHQQLTQSVGCRRRRKAAEEKSFGSGLFVESISFSSLPKENQQPFSRPKGLFTTHGLTPLGWYCTHSAHGGCTGGAGLPRLIASPTRPTCYAHHPPGWRPFENLARKRAHVPRPSGQCGRATCANSVGMLMTRAHPLPCQRFAV